MMKSPVTADRQREDALLVQDVQAGDTQSFRAIHAFVSLTLPVPNLVGAIAHETTVKIQRLWE